MKKSIFAVVVAALLFPAVASAQGGAATTAPSASADEQQAQALSDQAYAAYEKNDFAKALELYLGSYKLVPTAEILYNVASIYDKKLNDPKLAVEYYRRHNAAPDAKPELVGKATARIAALSAPAGGGGGVGAGAGGDTGAAQDKSDSGKTLRLAGLIAGGVGIVGLGVGGVTGLVASGKHDDSKCADDRCPDQGGVDREKDAATMATVSTIGFIAGGVLLAAGVVMYLVAPKAEKRTGYILPAVGARGASGMNAVFTF